MINLYAAQNFWNQAWAIGLGQWVANLVHGLCCNFIFDMVRLEITRFIRGKNTYSNFWMSLITFAWRKSFGVPAGADWILNEDEIMTYRYDPSTWSWNLWFDGLEFSLELIR